MSPVPLVQDDLWSFICVSAALNGNVSCENISILKEEQLAFTLQKQREMEHIAFIT